MSLSLVCLHPRSRSIICSKIKLFATFTVTKMSSSNGRSRKRAVPDTGSAPVPSSTKLKSSRSRRPAIKIEVDEDESKKNLEEIVTNAPGTTSKYFKTEAVSVKTEPEEEVSDSPSNLEVEDEGKVKPKLKKSPGKSPSKKAPPVSLPPPPNWEEIFENIKKMRSGRTAVVDTMGCERTADLKQEPKVTQTSQSQRNKSFLNIFDGFNFFLCLFGVF